MQVTLIPMVLNDLFPDKGKWPIANSEIAFWFFPSFVAYKSLSHAYNTFLDKKCAKGVKEIENNKVVMKSKENNRKKEGKIQYESRCWTTYYTSNIFTIFSQSDIFRNSVRKVMSYFLIYIFFIATGRQPRYCCLISAKRVFCSQHPLQVFCCLEK